MAFQNLISAILLLVISSCSVMLKNHTERYGPASPKERVLSEFELQQNKHISFNNEVQPVLTQRCAVCHSCNDAPCQINFTSIEGIDRGASSKPVYNGSRFFSQEPTRLDIDANSTAQWRAKQFTPILNEHRQNEQINLDNSLLYKVLTTKRKQKFLTKGRLSKEYNIGQEIIKDQSFVHSQTCPDIEAYEQFSQNNPHWGMPFALPALNYKEFKTIEMWLEQGAQVEPREPLSAALQDQIKQWETLLNATSKKQKLVSRYIFEHLFSAHLYFDDVSSTQFFTLVRSKTPPGEKIKIINSTRPYDDPHSDKFYYRVKRYNRVIVNKTHMPYSLNKKRMQRYQQLFLNKNYNVTHLPSYEVEQAANPFKTFAAIPAKSRYQFLLDDAQFFVSGFIKGPVCRGSIALNVIDDHFWVVFMDPEKSYLSKDSEFIKQNSEKLRLPTEKENTLNPFSIWSTYQETAREYMHEKAKYLNKKMPNGQGFGLEQIWDADHTNDNVALTVYRHYDSATVLKGFVGEIPKTGWVIDYPIFERIHYLLSAGFNVYGTVGHQLSTRLYMDFIRYEAELEFLAFLPTASRMKIHEYWYRGTGETKHLIKELKKLKFSHKSKIKFESIDVKKEFYEKLSHYLYNTNLEASDYINRCKSPEINCNTKNMSKIKSKVTQELHKISDIDGVLNSVFPDSAFLRIKVDGTVQNDLVYTILRNNFYLNTMSLLNNDDMRIRKNDSLDIIPGFVGAYPNFFFEVDIKDISKFVKLYQKIKDSKSYTKLVTQYGIRRSNPNFWQVSDWFYKKSQHDNRVYSGLFDLNRYKNR
ncbi:Fatty acid cis/trans isomerase [hydrothermal vent metagenome]|uniref:Fatty acid cis/trans isomerase n=1 Tax=hydrothermal vent metagenome TaxID=652676 RepID=A0A3B1B121_9ZZZZ